VVFGVLIDNQQAPKLEGISTAPGDEHLLRTYSSEILQRVVGYIQSQIEPALTITASLDTSSIEVAFTNNVRLQYPVWMLKFRGHDLLPVYQRVFGRALITPPNLNRSFGRVRLIPLDLATVMSRLQT